MSATHCYVLHGGTDWATAGVKATGMWVYRTADATWHPVKQQYIWYLSAWQPGYTTTPGPLDHVAISPVNPTVPSGGTQQFTVLGYDADNLLVDISGDTIAWSVSTFTDSIDSTGLFHAGSNPGSTVTVTVAVNTTFQSSTTVTIS